MRIYAFILLLSMASVLSDGQVKLSKDDYLAYASDPLKHPENTQIYYYESYLSGNYMLSKTLVLYGDDISLFTYSELTQSDEEIAFYSSSDDKMVEDAASNIVSLGLFESRSEVKYLLDYLGASTHEYYLSLRAGDKHYTLLFGDLVDVEPSWKPLVEYMQGIMDEYMVEDNEIEASEYLNILQLQQEVYGIHPQFSGYSAEKYIEEHKLD